MKRNRIDFISYFLPPERKKIAEEYLLYDIIGVIGAVGGTMGLCIGFSIFGINTKHFLKECITKTVYFQGLVLSGIEFMEIFVEKKKNSKITKVEPIKSGNNNY